MESRSPGWARVWGCRMCGCRRGSRRRRRGPAAHCPPLTARAGPAALQHFSEGTLEYLANLDQAPDPTVRKDAFASHMSSAYDILFQQWLQSREAKVRRHLAGRPLPPRAAWASAAALRGLYSGGGGLVRVEAPCARSYLQVPPERTQLVAGPQVPWSLPPSPTALCLGPQGCLRGAEAR